MQVLPDQTILLSPGESLPDVFLGRYFPMPGEPNRYKIGFPLCIYHDQAQMLTLCKRMITTDHCQLKDIFISPRICGRCNERVQGSKVG